MSTTRPSAGGGRWVRVAPERLERWLDGFAGRHGPLRWEATAERLTVTAADGAVAELMVPFPPLAVRGQAPYGGLVEHARAERVVGVALVRLGGFAVGVFDGERLRASKCGSRPVHGRAAAGGRSQRRFARRREGQARVALAAAADAAAAVLLPVAAELAAVVGGGDRRALATVLADRRLAPLRPLLAADVLDVPEPRRSVLESAPARFRAVRVRLPAHEPA
ncbi:MAG TPA: acVLRF1 family peptidyl-tRNA hydrolase [Actinomycetes bacterium]